MALFELLSVVGVVAAVWALLDPSSRAFAELVVRRSTLFATLCILLVVSFVLHYWPGATAFPKCVATSLEVGSYLLPLVIGGYYFHRITDRRLGETLPSGLVRFLDTSLVAGRFDLVRDVATKNARTLTSSVDRDVLVALGHREFIRDSLERERLDVIKLLLHPAVRETLRPTMVYPRLAISLLDTPSSPVRRAIAHYHGAADDDPAGDQEFDWLRYTFESPSWFIRSGARYHFLMRLIDELESGRLDNRYNDVAGSYVRTQGRSERADCAVFLGIHFIGSSLVAAAKQRFDGDCYATDLADVGRTILKHTSITSPAWQNRDLIEWKTPFHFLVCEIVGVLEEVCREAARADLGAGGPPSAVFTQAAQAWSMITARLLQDPESIPEPHRSRLASRQVDWMLRLQGDPYAVLLHVPPISTEKHVRVFTEEYLRQVGWWGEGGGEAIAERLLNELDAGKRHVDRELLRAIFVLAKRKVE